MKNNKGLYLAYWAVVLVMLALGAVGLYWRLTAGHKMANYGQLVVWGLWVAMYIFFVGISAGAFIVASLTYTFNIECFRPLRRLALLTSLIAMPLGLLSIWFDLGHMGRFYEMYTRPHWLSMMAVEVWLYTTFLIVLAVMIWLEFGRGGQGSENTLKWLGAIGLVLVVLYEGANGAMYGVAAARPAWHGGLFPLLFILSGFSVGVATLAAIYAFLPKEYAIETRRQVMTDLGKLLLALVILEALFTFAEYSIALYSSVPSEIAPLMEILTGSFWYVFWIGQVVLGIVLPIVVLWWRRTRENPVWVGIAGLGVVLATLAMRLNIVIPALTLPELEGLVDAVPSPRMSTLYVPSPMEWFLSIGIIGLGMALFAIGYNLLLVRSQAAKEV
ncbi:MAG TPA: hypothetical protein EYP04_10610 [Anaerolineae bacterium]|nr:hypothetical protein [Anaerolineae bacterium]